MTKAKIKETIGLLTEAINTIESGGLPQAPPGTAAKLFEARAALAMTVHGRSHPSMLSQKTDRAIRATLSRAPNP